MWRQGRAPRTGAGAARVEQGFSWMSLLRKIVQNSPYVGLFWFSTGRNRQAEGRIHVVCNPHPVTHYSVALHK